MNAHDVVILHTTVNVPFEQAYSFAKQPENFPKWAAGMSSSLHKTERGWVAAAPQGEAIVRFTDTNPFGILDHWVQLVGKPEIYIPLRMLANGRATEVELVLLQQPDMSDSDFKTDQGLVRKDLATLKGILENL